MSLDLTLDLDVFFADFAVPVVISETGLEDVPTEILFDVNSIDMAGVLTDRPQGTIRTSALAGFTMARAVITCNGVRYNMTKPLDDGAGLTVTGLKREQ